MKLLDEYYKKIDDILAYIRNTQDSSIHQAADAIVESVSNNGEVHLFDTGHTITQEFQGRVGSFLFIKPFSYSLYINQNQRQRDLPKECPEYNLTEVAFANSNVRKGDIFIVGSVSGKSNQVLDYALTAKKFGCKLIALTSIEFSSTVTPEHPCGKRLYEVADIVLDHKAPYGDSMIEVAGMDEKIIPSSNIGASYIMWAMCAIVAEKLTVSGIYPTVLRSVNIPEGYAKNGDYEGRYLNKGY